MGDEPVAAVSSSHRRVLAAVALAYAAAAVAALAAGWAVRGRHPILVAAVADVAATLVVFAFGVAHDNSSLYDPYWSVAPVPIAAWWAAVGDAPALRKTLVLVLVTAWATRLTANCLVRWRSLADEDFRYVEIRRKAGRAYWPASLAGIHLMPTLWVFLGLLPLWPALGLAGRPPGALDAVAALVTAGAILVEATADLQLRRHLASRPPPEAVLDRGLWAWCRHPNYLGEVAFWWGLWLFGVAAAPGWAWTAIGPLSITCLFAFVSVPWMDRRMASRHPEWAARTRGVPALLPWPRRRS
ncbi:MAG TPA: DUF1295 domain-containing protein [Anaeromyxobacteraceae bacterium]|nr:DUF1295 domain-containing protein [Anaeromyxobacteraceae bacterium]